MNSNGSGCNTIFLRLEGPLQSWGDTSKFVMRRTMEAPTKSGIIGLICCAMGRDRQYVVQEPIPGEELRPLASRLVEQRKENANEPRRAFSGPSQHLVHGRPRQPDRRPLVGLPQCRRRHWHDHGGWRR